MSQIDLLFEVEINAVLDKERERAPFAIAYLTEDVRSSVTGGVGTKDKTPGSEMEFVASDKYQKRVVTAAVNGSTMPSVGGSAAQSKPLVFSAHLRMNKPSELQRDAAVCIQVYCEVDCHGGLWGSHACGWAGAVLSALKDVAVAGKSTYTLLLRDTGQSAPGVRGTIQLHFGNETVGVLKGLNFSSKSEFDHALPEGSKVLVDEMVAYDETCAAIFNKLSPVSRDIRLARLPMYASCGGVVVRPPCSFVLSSPGRPTPITGEECYLRALDAVLARKFPQTNTQERARLFMTQMPHNEQGAVLIDVALFVPSACVYLFDEVFATEGGKLITGEEFSRHLAFTLCGDCEDMSYLASIVLKVILEGPWESEAMKALQKVRARYVCTIPLKAVTRYDAGGKAAQVGGLAAHDCCDLVPIIVLDKMIGTHTVITDIIAQRKAQGLLADVAGQMYVIVGEGTGRIAQFVRPGEPAAALDTIKGRAMRTFSTGKKLLTVATPMVEETTSEHSDFYRYIISGIIHDSLLHAESMRKSGKTVAWEVPQVVYATRKDGQLVYGASHSAYVRGDAVALPSPAPTAHQEAAMRHLEKFEMPVVKLDPPGADMSMYSARTAAISTFVKKRTRSVVNPSGATNVFVSLWELNDAALESLGSWMDRDGLIVHSCEFEHVADGVAFVAFLVSPKM